jgi:hypothetical protein
VPSSSRTTHIELHALVQRLLKCVRDAIRAQGDADDLADVRRTAWGALQR